MCEDIVACFESLCGVCSSDYKAAITLARMHPLLMRWSAIERWALWWTKASHLKMPSKTLSLMAPDLWDKSPTTTNTVERRNCDCKSVVPQPIKLAMMNTYRLDKADCCKHISAEEGTSVSYRARDENACRENAEARRRQCMQSANPDQSAQHGPPDHSTNFVSGQIRA